MKFLHAADLHLDSPLLNLERYEGAPVERMRQATRRAFDNLVALALAERVDFVLLAGDLFDGDWKDYNTGLYLVRRLRDLRAAAIPVFAIAGNHDAASRMTRQLQWPDNVRMLAVDRPETCLLDDLGVAIHGQGFATQAVTDNLARAYPAPVRGLCNIGLLHTAAEDAGGEHEPYAPCSLDDLRHKGYDYWALGHIHQRRILSRTPWIVFPGNTQGRHVRETGPRGCMLVEGNGSGLQAEFRPLDVLRWERLVVDVVDCADVAAALERTEQALGELLQSTDDLPAAVRVELIGAAPVHDELHADPTAWANQVRAAALDLAPDRLWIEKVRLRTEPPRGLDHLLEGPLQEILRVLEECRSDDAALREVAADLEDLRRKLPAELQQGPDALDLAAPEAVRRLLDEVRPMLLTRLLGSTATTVDA